MMRLKVKEVVEALKSLVSETGPFVVETGALWLLDRAMVDRR